MVEEDSGKYGLPGGGAEGRDYGSLFAALKRELGEELGKGCKIVRSRNLGIRIKTRKQINNVFALECRGNIKKLEKETSKQDNKKNNEIHGFALYPLNKIGWLRRKYLERKMEGYAKEAVKQFRNKRHRKENYVSSNVRFKITNQCRYMLFGTIRREE